MGLSGLAPASGRFHSAILRVTQYSLIMGRAIKPVLKVRGGNEPWRPTGRTSAAPGGRGETAWNSRLGVIVSSTVPSFRISGCLMTCSDVRCAKGHEPQNPPISSSLPRSPTFRYRIRCRREGFRRFPASRARRFGSVSKNPPPGRGKVPRTLRIKGPVGFGG